MSVKKIKVVAVSIWVALAATPVFAGGMNGFFMTFGAGLRALWQSSAEQATLAYRDSPVKSFATLTLNTQGYEHANQRVGFVGLGYGHQVLDHIYMSWSARYYFSSPAPLALNALMRTTDKYYNAHFKHVSQFANQGSITQTVGYVLPHHWLPVVRMGYASRVLKVSQQAVVSVPDLPPSRIQNNFHVHLHGAVLGVGLRHLLVRHLSLVLEYDYAWYVPLDVHQKTTVTTSTDVQTFETDMKINHIQGASVLASLLVTW